MALARCQQVDGRIGLKIDLATQPTTDVEDIARRRTRSPVQQGRAQDPERRRQRPRRTSCIAPSPGPRLNGGAGGGTRRDRGRRHHRRRRRGRGGRRGCGGPGGRLTQGAELGARAARFREGGGSVQASPRSCAPGAPQRRREIWRRSRPRELPTNWRYGGRAGAKRHLIRFYLCPRPLRRRAPWLTARPLNRRRSCQNLPVQLQFWVCANPTCGCLHSPPEKRAAPLAVSAPRRQRRDEGGAVCVPLRPLENQPRVTVRWCAARAATIVTVSTKRS